MGSSSPFAHLSTLWASLLHVSHNRPHYTCLSHRSPHSQQTNQTFPQLYSKKQQWVPLLTHPRKLTAHKPKKTPKPQTPKPVLFAIQRKTPKFPQCNKSPSRDPIFGMFTCTPLLRTFPQTFQSQKFYSTPANWPNSQPSLTVPLLRDGVLILFYTSPVLI
jgi:hypothetical protein